MPEPKGGIEWMKRKLYSRTEALPERGRRALHEEHYENVHTGWEHPDAPVAPPSATKNWVGPSPKTVRFVLMGSIAFFVLSIGVALLMFFGGGNTVSAENIAIEVAGPLAVPGGAPLDLSVEIVNNNAVPIKLADLIVEYPDGTRAAGDLNVPLPRMRETLGTIEPGGRVKTSVKAILFGNEDSQKKILMAVEYRIDGSNAIFYKEREYNVILSSAPIAIAVESLKEISSGQEVALVVNLASNSTQTLQDILLEADYPFGFEFRTADPPALKDNSVWAIGDMLPGTSRKITITGVLAGERNDERIFRFAAGSAKTDSPRELAATFEAVEIPIAIKQPFMGITLAVNGNASAAEPIAPRDQPIRVDIQWVNNLPMQIYDAEITAQIGGTAFDRNKVETTDGFYRSQDHTIIWSGETTKDLARIDPGDHGNLRFSLTPLSLAIDPTLPAPTISINVDVKARRVSEANVPESLESSIQRTVRLQSSLQLAGRSVYSIGPFDNSGPVPPKAETETTYTIIWSVANSTSDIEQGQITARLPSYVKWLGKTSPAGERVTYNPIGGEVMWDIGDIPAKTGFELPLRDRKSVV